MDHQTPVDVESEARRLEKEYGELDFSEDWDPFRINQIKKDESDYNLSFMPNKTPFRLKKNKNGNILSVHHTVQEGNRVIRIRMGACCFSGHGKFVAIDKRGNVFIFDLVAKSFWKLALIVLKASIIVPNKQDENEFLIGTKVGQLMLVDIEHSLVLLCYQISGQYIRAISFPDISHPKRCVLVHAGSEAIMVNLNTLEPTHRLNFDDVRLSLKFASYVPQMEQIFTCFTNDSIHIWSSASLKTVQTSHPIRTRDRKIRATTAQDMPVIQLEDKECSENDFLLETCDIQNFSDGLIGAYCFTLHGTGCLCLATRDKYLLLLNPRTFDLQKIIRLRDFVIRKCFFLPQPNNNLLLALTTKGKVILLDCQNTHVKLIIHNCAVNIEISSDGELLAVIGKCGEADLWNTSCLHNTLVSQQHCMDMLKDAFKQSKPVRPTTNECFNEDIKKLLQRDRLLAILKEYGFYPDKYRNLIWCSLLKLPCNRVQYQELLKLGTPSIIRQRVEKLNLKNENEKRILIKTWSCLANWCKVFAHSDFFPNLILPFVKMFPKNGIINFELIATLLLNHFQLWFEFHPLPPKDYLGMCENVLQFFDADLWTFFNENNIKAIDFAWPILSTSFSEVLDKEQWLILWDHIVSCPIEFIIFCIVGYNIILRDVIILLPNIHTIKQFFHERNPINIQKLIKKSLAMMNKCPGERNPERYFEFFSPIPRNVYPKFLRFPREWVTKQEDELLLLKREQEAIEERMRELELKEQKVITELEEGLKKEENAKRLKEMESLYIEAIKREEEHVAGQRKLLALYQKEIRGCSGKVLTTLRECESRKRAIEMDTQLKRLMNSIDSERRRINSNLVLVEDELKNKNFEGLAQRYCLEHHTYTPDLGFKFRNDLLKLTEQQNLLYQQIDAIHARDVAYFDEKKENCGDSHNLSEIERKFEQIQQEFLCITKRT